MKRFFLVLFLVCFFWSSGTWAGEQTSGTTVQTIIDVSRQLIRENDSSNSYITDARLLNYVNMGVQDISSKTRCLETVQTIFLSTGITEYALGNSGGVSFFTVTTARYWNASTEKGLRKGNPQSIGHVATSSGEPVFWYQSANYLGIYPAPSSTISGNSIFVYLAKRPVALSATSAITTPAVFDNLLVYYVTAMAFYTAENNPMGDLYMSLYNSTLVFYKADMFDRPIEPMKEIIKQ